MAVRGGVTLASRARRFRMSQRIQAIRAPLPWYRNAGKVVMASASTGAANEVPLAAREPRRVDRLERDAPV